VPAAAPSVTATVYIYARYAYGDGTDFWGYAEQAPVSFMS
jgi:hypothetical protein